MWGRDFLLREEKSEETMAYFPLYIEIEGKKCVVVGGGRIAAGKVRQLLEFKARVTVIAPEVTEEIKALAEDGKVALEQRTVFGGKEEQTGELDGTVCALIRESALVVAATDQTTVNVKVSKLCKENHILVNVVDVKELCTFFFPAIVKREDVVVAVSTSGSSPALAAKLRRELETQIPKDYGRAAAVMGEYREYIKEQVSDISIRKRIFESLLVEVMENGTADKAEVDRIIKEQNGELS